MSGIPFALPYFSTVPVILLKKQSNVSFDQFVKNGHDEVIGTAVFLFFFLLTSHLWTSHTNGSSNHSSLVSL